MFWREGVCEMSHIPYAIVYKTLFLVQFGDWCNKYKLTRELVTGDQISKILVSKGALDLNEKLLNFVALSEATTRQSTILSRVRE